MYRNVTIYRLELTNVKMPFCLTNAPDLNYFGFETMQHKLLAWLIQLDKANQ